MIKYIFLLILCIGVKLSYSQSTTWCPPGAKWYYGFNYDMVSNGYLECKYIGDTLIGSISSKVLQETQYWRSIFGGPINSNNIRRFTYESNNIVFANIFNQWDTIINFNSAPGERWHWNSSDTSYVQVLDTGSRVINGLNLHWLYVQYHTPIATGPMITKDTIFERIGYIGIVYPFHPDAAFVFDAQFGGFCSYSDSTFGHYGNADSICTSLPTGIKEIGDNVMMLTYPNPATDKITISSTINGNISITNILGQQVYSSIKQSPETSIELTIPEGVYFIHLKNKEGSVVKKFVKE